MNSELDALLATIEAGLHEHNDYADGQTADSNYRKSAQEALETLRSKLAALEAERDAMLSALRKQSFKLIDIKDIAEDQQGEWLPVIADAAPDWTHPYKDIVDMAREAITLPMGIALKIKQS